MGAGVFMGGCGEGGGSGFPYPPQEIVLCGNGCVTGANPNDRAERFVFGNGTFVWDSPYLGSTTQNTPGDIQRLIWTPARANQELIAFNYDLGEWVRDPTCTECFNPYTWSYASLAGNSYGFDTTRSLDYGFDEAPNGPTFSVARYWHGACAVQVPWVNPGGELDPLRNISDQLFKAVVCNAEDQFAAASVARVYDEIQPHFTGLQDFSFAGLMMNAQFTVQFGPFVLTIDINPAWSFGVREDDGLLQVETLQRRTVVIGDTFGLGVKESIDEALDQTFGRVLEQQVADAVTISLTEILPVLCDPEAPLADQQQQCFDVAMPLAPAGFAAIWAQDGSTPATAQALGQRAADGLEPRNFVCRRENGRGVCAFHPVILRVNVLPDELEFVLAGELSDQSWLYATLERATGQQICGLPVRPRTGRIALHQSGPADDDEAIPGSCAPYLP